MSVRATLIAVLALLAVPAAAHAAPPWSPPQPIAGSTEGAPQLVFTASGRGLALTWSNQDAPMRTGVLTGAFSEGAGPFGPARVLGRLNLVALRTYGRDRLVAFGTTGSRHLRPAVAFGRPDEPFAGAREIGPRGRDAYVVAADANAGGDIAILLRVCANNAKCGRTVPYLVVRRAGESFSDPIRLAGRGPTVSGAVAVNARGDALVAWERPVTGGTGTRAIYARVRTLGGRLGSARRLGTGEPFITLSAALGAGRRGLVAWMGQRVSEGDAGGPATIQVAGAPAGEPFGPARIAERVPVTGTGRYVKAPGVRAAIGADGGALLAWTGYAGERFVVRTAAVEGTALGEPQIVSDPAQDTVLAALATGPAGMAAVLGDQGIRGADPSGPIALVAAVRAAGGAAFGPLETVAPRPAATDSAVAFAGGAPVAVLADIGARLLVASARAPLALP